MRAERSCPADRQEPPALRPFRPVPHLPMNVLSCRTLVLVSLGIKYPEGLGRPARLDSGEPNAALSHQQP